MISLCSSSNSMKRSSLSFLSPIPNAPMLLNCLCVLVPIFALKSLVIIFYFEQLTVLLFQFHYEIVPSFLPLH